MKLRVELNGTKENPYARWGLKQNPFPQIAKAEYTAGCLRLQSLGGEPIPNEQHIRDTLKGFDAEFVELCVKQFKPGAYVRFEVEFPEP